MSKELFPIHENEKNPLITYFVSHAPDQFLLANAVAHVLDRRGESCSILYEWDFDPEEDFVVEISDALVDADLVVCIVSPLFLSSAWCLKELIATHHAGKLITILTDDVDTAKLTNIGINDSSDLNQRIDVRGMNDNQKVKEIQSKLNLCIDNFTNMKQFPDPDREFNYEEVFSFVEQIPITLGSFEGVEGAWRQDLELFLTNNFEGNNVLFQYSDQVISSKQQALEVLENSFTDIVFYGQLSDIGILNIGFVTTRGWNFNSKEINATPDELIFDTQTSNFWDLYVVLKVAIANLETARKRYAISASCLSEAIKKVNPLRAAALRLPHILFNQGKQYLVAEEFEEAIQCLTEAIELGINFPYVYFYRACAFSDLNMQEHSIVDFDKAIHLDPGFAEAYYQRGKFFRELNSQKGISRKVVNTNQILNDFSEAIRLTPINRDGALNNPHNLRLARYLNGRGSVYLLEKDYQNAVLDLNIALDIEPDNLVYRRNRMIAYENLGMKDRADIDRKYIQSHPNLSDLIQALLPVANGLTRRGEYGYAFGLFKDLLEYDPNFTYAYEMCGALCFTLRRDDEAISYCEKALELDPTSKTALSTLRKIYASEDSESPKPPWQSES